MKFCKISEQMRNIQKTNMTKHLKSTSCVLTATAPDLPVLAEDSTPAYDRTDGIPVIGTSESFLQFLRFYEAQQCLVLWW